MRTILVLAATAALGALTACGSSDPATDVIDCEPGAWSGIETATKCARACAAGPACDGPPYDDACLMTLPVCKQGARLDCANDHVAAYDGAFGCCQADRQNTLAFERCE